MEMNPFKSCEKMNNSYFAPMISVMRDKQVVTHKHIRAGNKSWWMKSEAIETKQRIKLGR